MKTHALKLLAAVLAIGAAGNALANDNCSVGSLRGAYVFLETGTIIGVGPVAAVGQLVTDGKGNVTSASVSENVNGSVLHLTATGTYTVKPDCTGSSVITESNGTVLHSDFAATDSGRIINFLSTDPGAVVSGVDTRE